MATTTETIKGIKRGGIYYTDTITGLADEGVLTASKIKGTSDADLIDTTINQTSARHVKKDVVIVRGRL
jgi:hypothetical protein